MKTSVSIREIIIQSRYFTLLALLIAILVGANCPKTGSPPVIDSLSPSSGPSGTIVLVNGDRFGTGGTVFFDDVAVETQGTGSPLSFTVPYSATVGNHDVHVRIDGHNSAKVSFNCTSVQSAPTPVADAFEVGYYVLLNSSDEDIMEIVVFGSGFDSNCEILWDGSAIGNTRLPGVPAGSLIGVFTGGVMTFREYPQARYSNSILALLFASEGTLPALGSSHTLAVRNQESGVTSNTLNITIPSRRVMVEMDNLTTTDWPPQVIWRNNTVNTLRRAYTNAGLLIDLRWDETVADPMGGSAFTDADVVDFFNNHSSMSGSVFTGEWYFHAGILTDYTHPSLPPGISVLGMMWDTGNRNGLALFSNAFTADAGYLRTFIHEMGHGFNLTHCEGDAVPQRDAFGNLVYVGGVLQYTTLGTTLMNQTLASAANWTYTFSNDSQTHLTTHPVNEVSPGSGNLSFNSSSRTFGSCEY